MGNPVDKFGENAPPRGDRKASADVPRLPIPPFPTEDSFS